MNNDDFQNVKLDRTKVVQDGTAVQTRHKIIFSKNKMIRVIADRYFSNNDRYLDRYFFGK